ncbi:caspase family protein [Allocoleopsis franciscana]|uniref:SH3b domain-containing protein n=1 Tax=Allocoleopsis franciscana PCC 7113 TaxID=1173027 RepID=K9WMA0_9CYAN|nr:caspase family protein [Allocoleopsis franciscana]AFZ20647.1 hypothetical protein Mic7113_4986 [Allocoleopsis franciscana PCC 7113]
MAKVALLIGVSEYGSGLHPLPDAVKDVEAVQQVLQSFKMGSFDEVKYLSNPNPPVMREAIETLFSDRTPDDLVLLFFSGHIVWDESGKVYFATAITPKSPRAELIRVSAIPINFVHDLISHSPCQHHIVILDCCLNLVSAPEIATHEEQTLEIKSLLDAKRQSTLACFTPIQESLEARDYPHSIYTRYLVEGIKTGAADLNQEGWISLSELHEYATQRTQIAAPALKPEFYSAEGGDKIVLFKAPLDDPNLKYRKAVHSWVNEGKISPAGRSSLDKLAGSLGIHSQEFSAIEAEVLKPYDEYQEKLQLYKRELAKVISYDYPLATPERKQLRIIQQCLGLREQDVAPIEEQMTLRLARLHESEDEAEKFTPTHSDSQPVIVSSGQKTVLQHSTRLLAEEPSPSTPEPEDEAEKFTPTHSDSQPVVASSGQKTVLQQFTRLLPEEPTPSTPESEDEAEKFAPAHSDNQPTVASSGQKTVLQHSTRLLAEEPTPPTPESEDEAEKFTPTPSDSQPGVASATQKTVLQQSTRLLPEEPTPQTPAGNLSSNSAESSTNSASASAFPYKVLIPLGIGGVLVAVALAVGISSRNPVTPPANLADQASSSASSSSPSSAAVKHSNQETSSTASPSPKSQNCMIFVNGNLRSEPIALESEVIESFKGALPVTGKRTDKGWIQVKLSSGKLAWAHPGIISSASEREMETCLTLKRNSN